VRAVRPLLAVVVVVVALIPALAAADNPAPTVAITSPSPGLTIAADSVIISATYGAPERSLITQLELLVDGNRVELCDLDPAEASGSASFTWVASRYPDGYHRLSLHATDSEGRVACAAIRVLLQRDQPALDSPLRITSPKAGETVAGLSSVQVEAGPPHLVKYVIFLVDDVFKAMSNIPPFIYLWDTTRYLNGLHHLQAKAYLSTGAEPLSPVVEVQVDNPSGATTMQQPKAPPAAPVAPEPAQPPARTGQPALPPPLHTESASPVPDTVEVAQAELATPGTAPFVSPAGDLVIPSPPSVAAAAEPIIPAPAEMPSEPPAPPAAAPMKAAVPAPPTQAPALSVSRPAASSVPAFAPAPPANPAPQALAQPREPQAAPTVIALLPAPASPVVAAPAQSVPAAAPNPAPVVLGPAPVSSPPLPAAAQVALLPSRPVEPAPVSRVSPAPAAEEASYVVQAGDCLWGIAADHKISPGLLAQVNGLSDPGLIHPGQRLRIPAAWIYCDGRPLATEVQPVVADGRAIVPLRAVVEAAGGTVNWRPADRQAQAGLGAHQLTVEIGSAAATVDGAAVTMAKPATLTANRTLVPLRFLGDALDLALRYQSGIIQIATAP
jgi:LysM repeat protein